MDAIIIVSVAVAPLEGLTLLFAQSQEQEQENFYRVSRSKELKAQTNDKEREEKSVQLRSYANI